MKNNKIMQLIISYFFSFVDKHHVWLNPILIFTTTLSAAFISFDISEKFKSDHTVLSPILSLFIDNSIWVLIISGFMLVIVTIIHTINQKTIFEIKKENTELSNKIECATNNYQMLSATIRAHIKDLFEGFLYTLSQKNLKFSQDDSSDRVSIYLFSNNDQTCFIPLCRYSSNPTFMDFSREEYPMNEGCIKIGWQKGWHFEIVPNNIDWIEHHKLKHNISKSNLQKRNMRPCLYAVKRIDQQNSDFKGLIVVESSKRKKYEEEFIKQELSLNAEYINTLLTKLNEYLPKNIKEKGL